MITVWNFMFRRHLLRMCSLSALALRNCKARPLIASLVFCAVGATAAIAMDRGQFANVPPEVREWFEHLQSPKGVPCCSTPMVTALATIRAGSILGAHRRRVVSGTTRGDNQDSKSR